MLKLKNVSKYYYNNGIVSSGFSKISISFSLGEFVAITGESGSGKSTLLNVISGLDSYEDGEMYINNEETSYYSETDFEEYRKKYIANIFQDFNLINSYTVYQNIELVFLLNNIKDYKEKINYLLEITGLTKFKNTKASKLSGGQKQRVAIARALAKDTPIIVADEPTGNLDVKNASEILKILHDVSKNKLVIVVTHNYDQIEKYATRKIKMSDGKIVEDIKLSNIEKINYDFNEYGKVSLLNKIKLSIRNTFNIIPKFLLLLLVYTFLSIAVFGEYASNKNTEIISDLFGINTFFRDMSTNRILINKNDRTSFTTDDINAIELLNNISKVVSDDVLLDTYFDLESDNVYLYGKVKSIDEIDFELDDGVLPSNNNELVIYISNNNYYASLDLLNNEYDLVNEIDYENLFNYKYKIVGIKYYDDDSYYNDSITIYINNDGLNDIRKNISKIYSNVNVYLNNNLVSNEYQNILLPSNNVESGKALVSDNYSVYCKDFDCKNNDIVINVENIYYSKNMDLKVSNIYTKNSFSKITGYDNYENYTNIIFVNTDDYYSLFSTDIYQISVFVENDKIIDETLKELNEMNYNTLRVSDAMLDYTKQIRVFTNLISFIGILFALVVLFFISYFIIKIILKSRNTYFSTMRILGASLKDLKMMIQLELLNVLNISYVIVMSLIVLIENDIIKNSYIKDLIFYLNTNDYIALYILLLLMSLLISNKFSKSLFKQSAMKTYRGEL